MDQRKTALKMPDTGTPAEKVLEERYPQLLKWGELITRGDREVAQEIVHELFLQVALSRPLLQEISNLDGYLYTCLKHVFLSRLSRASREAVRFVSVEDYDSIQSIFEETQLDRYLETQNELRRICAYSVWRKESSKSFCYFVLHFFHGYFHREIAELACLPVSAIYNKLKNARTEIRSHLNGSATIRIIGAHPPPEPAPFWSPVTPSDLFKDLRETILRARVCECLPEEELIAYYLPPGRGPVPCSLLAHIVSCESCLAVVDRHFRRPTLRERDFLDGIDRSSNGSEKQKDATGKPALRSALERRRRRMYEHHPAALSISVNGEIIASHDVQGEQSVLTARISRPETVQFVEVFSEQDIRLLLLPIQQLPPEGPSTLTQDIVLSDARRLGLRLSFDGLGLHSELTYYDPSLALQLAGDSLEPESQLRPEDRVSEKRRSLHLRHEEYWYDKSWMGKQVARIFSRFSRPWIAGWAFALVLLMMTAGYVAYRHAQGSPGPEELLSRSLNAESLSLRGKVEHQVLHFETVSADGRSTQQGAIDLWRDGDSPRSIRRLYSPTHRLIAAEWKDKDGKQGSYTATNEAGQNADRSLMVSDYWQLDISSRIFRQSAPGAIKVRRIENGYELTAAINDRRMPQVVSATLILNNRLEAVGEVLHMRANAAVRDVRFTRVKSQFSASADTPDSTFQPTDMGFDPSDIHKSGHSGDWTKPQQHSSATDAQLTELQIRALYTLNRVGVDTADPVEVARVDGVIRISGLVASNAEKRQITASLQALPHAQLLEIRIASQSDLHRPVGASQTAEPHAVHVYDVSQAAVPGDAAIRRHLESQGFGKEQLDLAVMQFSGRALQHSQRALQNAYALDRLAGLSAEELRSTPPEVQQEWTEMVAKHLSALQVELSDLRDQLDSIAPAGTTPSHTDFPDIDRFDAFAQSATLLLNDLQRLNKSVSQAFTAGTTEITNEDADRLISNAAQSIPIELVNKMSKFSYESAVKDHDAGKPEANSVEHR